MKKAFDKYWHYRHSVQSPDEDVKFINNCYHRIHKVRPLTFREDFCFTFAVSCAWVTLGERYKSIAIDIDKKPLVYGQKNYLSLLTPSQQKRVKVICSNVLKANLPKVDIISAMNFSYFTFKTRKEMKNYFSNCYKSLNSKGLLVLDCFGGSECYSANEEVEPIKDFIYYWDQEGFDPVSNYSMFRIHYKRKGEKKRKNVFTYDWRIWSIPELKDILEEVGFRKIHVYWEGTNKDGSGDGRFVPVTKGEDCEAWIAYLMAEKS